MKVPHDPDEILAVVDDKDTVVGKAKRREVHEKKILHREVGIFLINSDNEVLLQKRLDHHIWDFSCSGHFPHNQSYEEAAAREFEEELGIKLGLLEFVELCKERFYSKITSNERFVKVFIVRKDFLIKDLVFDSAEIETVKYFSKKELVELVNSTEKVICFAPKLIIEKYILGMLK